MSTQNYVANAWEKRFLLKERHSSAERFSIGFAIGALLTAVMFLWIDVASAAVF
jgi:hypothetical protein